MEFLQSIDFLIVGLVILFIKEFFDLFRLNSMSLHYAKSMSGEKTFDWELDTSGCVVNLFYLAFNIYLLFTEYWFPGLILLFLGVLTSTLCLPHVKRYKRFVTNKQPGQEELIKSELISIKNFLMLDRVISLIIISWMGILHLTQIGIIA